MELRSKENLLKEVSEWLLERYPGCISIEDKEEKRKQLKAYMSLFFKEKGISDLSLIDDFINDMTEYSVLTNYLTDREVEEININGWNDLVVSYSDGRNVKLKEAFYSPQHALDIVKRLLHHSGMILDNATPIAQGHLPNNTRITAVKSPILDAERGVAVSIRIVHAKTLSREALIANGYATPEMIELLELCIRYGASVVVAGRTSSGKTTLLNMLLDSIPDEKRIYTIESGAREMDLIKRDSDGNIKNNVVHTLSRQSDSKSYEVTQEDLVITSLRFDPDIICVGEMRDSEANAAVEASFTGHTLLSSVHSGPGEDAHLRIALLCQRRLKIDFKLSMFQAAKAFPIVVFAHKLEDGTRRIMDISECYIGKDGERVYNRLFKFEMENGGHFEKVNGISDSLANQLMQHGADKLKVNSFR